MSLAVLLFPVAEGEIMDADKVDRFIHHLQNGGFVKEKEITFPHKQSWFGRLKRENWDGPSL